jgi:hypothetical protein
MSSHSQQSQGRPRRRWTSLAPRRLASALFLLTALPAALAAAAPPRVVVLPFIGPGGEVFEQEVVRHVRATALVPLVEVDEALARGGYKDPMSSADHAGLAGRLRATAVVQARVQAGDIWRLRLTVRQGVTGTAVGKADFAGKGRQGLMAEVSRKGPAALRSLLMLTAPPAPALAAAALPGWPRRRGAPAESTVASRGGMSTDGAEGAPAGELAADARDSAASQAQAIGEISVGPRLMSRTFVFTDNVAGLPGYTLPMAMGIFGEAELFPAARSRNLLRYLGLAGQWETSVGAKTTGREGGRKHATSIQSFRVGPRYRIYVADLAVTLGADYGEHSFELDLDEAIPPNVAYTYVRPSLAGRLVVGTGISLALTAAYLHVTSVGGLGDQTRFPRMTAVGAELGASVGYQLTPDFELRLAADLRHYAHNMKVQAGDPLLVGGAVDEHFGASLLVTYRLR